MHISATAEKAIKAYGGMKLWQAADYIEAEVSAHGLAFILKRRPFFKHAKILLQLERPFCRLTPIGKMSTITGVLDGQNVRLEDQDGEVVAEREKARKYFSFGRRLLYWDDLDMAYFANYAFWNYFTLPVLLMRKDIHWTEIEPGLLEGKFPNGLPTHSLIQRFQFDDKTGLLIQHDYSADIISKFAIAANVVLKHSESDGMVYASSRRVTPRSPKGKPLKAPILIDIEVHNFKYIKIESKENST